MGYQPPLAKVLLKFCEGHNEADIANSMDLSLYNVQQRLNKAVRVSQQFLWRKE
jgi:DNA-directed RNA polymerase specialized sigma24 family protein